ncbi:adenylyl-sulfate kinase [Pseudomonas sp. AOB-7]|uniref:adenylyl-sulfate kinase n=1 Tax=Pseudomonas sp. AOB-7 TaxID=2482750 RepID=UPI00211433EB|nr:adenylyl-sulfate kinase [Pseudomonas sp. AOB-7]
MVNDFSSCYSVSRQVRAQQKNQRPMCIWLTGLSGSGKSTLSTQLEQVLHARGLHTMVLDGDIVRQGLCRDLGMSDADRSENIRRVAEVARLMVEAGLIVIVALISPFRKDRQAARELFAEGEFLEVFVDAPLETCSARDPKGLYAKVRSGQIKNFTGVDSPYEAPEHPDVHIRSAENDVVACVQSILGRMGLRDVQ